MAEKTGAAELAAYVKRYGTIEEEFLTAAGSFGLAFAEADGAGACYDDAVAVLVASGAQAANEGKSVWTQWKSPACVACMRGVGTETFLTSTACPRQCFFCFNPNQEDYEFFRSHANPIADQLRERHREGAAMSQLAITGGEPLLHLPQVLEFLEVAAQLYPDAYTRLYTSGFGWNDEAQRALADAGLAEVRFSIKMEDDAAAKEEVLAAIASAVGHFDNVMVEMPVMPGDFEAMRDLIVRLDKLGVAGINLLELCFPFHNAEAFAERGYQLKPSPYRVLYDYWYGGGLPIAGSEDTCLALVRFALEAGLSLGVHYCSLENKLTGQVFQQNAPAARAFPGYEMDARDFFLKAVKAFGPAVPMVRRALESAGLADTAEENADYGFIQFPPSALAAVRDDVGDVALGLSIAIVEHDEEGMALRELKVQPIA
ncbi:radical SAM protein [Adlercreutzia sp. R21]|uniref:radical SAM protein n=1 Tax=Adlercreutzia wanghongyangiae TaxID=3111451 RepID=UPI002DB5D54A|nr:radical SAM protein [Adlercreutzia sp. R21]MEC4184413.1 radical SAM protein [Adlercreutzia sp. R21]